MVHVSISGFESSFFVAHDIRSGKSARLTYAGVPLNGFCNHRLDSFTSYLGAENVRVLVGLADGCRLLGPVLELAIAHVGIVQFLFFDDVCRHSEVQSRAKRVALAFPATRVVRISPVVRSLVKTCSLVISFSGLHS